MFKDLLQSRIGLPFIAAIVFLIGCDSYSFRSNYRHTNELIHDAGLSKEKPYLKAHLNNGDVCVLNDKWAVDTTTNTLIGTGTHFDFNREKVTEGALSIPIDSVAIFETNQKLDINRDARIVPLTILAALDVALGIHCLTNPKACFGSCPTFYMNEKNAIHYADAEGFSNAIAPGLEYSDVDALNNPGITGSEFSLTMKNEALETHCIRQVKLLACERGPGERVFQGRQNNFYTCKNEYLPAKVIAPEGDITDLLQRQDRRERFSLADPQNLSSKEEMVLTFKNENTGNKGLVISFRQTLMTTYFIYSAMGYMGDEVGDYFALLEKNKNIQEQLKSGIQKELGDIEIYLQAGDGQDWKFAGGLYETGPIAFNNQIIPLGRITGDEVRVKLVMNKGLWRLDHVGLTDIIGEAGPLEVNPYQVFKNGRENQKSLEEVVNDEKLLISMPGSEFRFMFHLPEISGDYELFLYSEGYYLEWMRESWIKDKDLWKLKQMIENPAAYLASEAGNYKVYETTMEAQFWGSRIDTKNFTYED